MDGILTLLLGNNSKLGTVFSNQNITVMNLKIGFVIFTLFTFGFNYAQKGPRIGYINMDYILENVSDYQNAKKQLDFKVGQWKSEIETKRTKIEDLKTLLENERALLTPELIKEREDDIAYEEQLVLDYQQKRFGPSGDLAKTKRQLIQPVQDQVFNLIQNIAKKKKMDFVFDKSADVVMLYAADKHDISDVILRSITRSEKRKQVDSKKEKEQLALDEAKSPEDDAKDKAKQDKIDAKKKAREGEKIKRQKAFEERRKKLLEQRKKRKDSILAVRKFKKDSIIAARKQKSTPPKQNKPN